MKTINKKTSIATFSALLCLLLASNCTSLTENLSTDPVNITNGNVIASSKYLASAQVALMGVFEGDVARTTGMWAGYFSGEDRQYVGLGQYSTSGQDYDVEWGVIYADVLNNTRLLKKNANSLKNYVNVGLAQAIEGMCIGLAADLWGDVPYSEATKYPKIVAPKFDTQASVYAAAHVLLDSALVNLTLSGNTTGDFLLGGSKSAWTAVIHTVKARLYLHQRNYASALTEAALGIPSATGNLMAPHGDSYLQNFNLFYSFLTYDRSGYMGANSYAPALLDASAPGNRNNAKTDETGRLNYYYFPGGGLNIGSISYEPNVLSEFDLWGNAANEDGAFGGVMSYPIVTWQENQLIIAEANMKIAAPNPANALAALNTLRAWMDTGAHINSGYVSYGNMYSPYVLADFAPGGIENTDNIVQNTALLREILQERYVTFIGQIEGFNDMRRTGNFLNIPLVAGKTNFPRRLLYSQIEVNTNPNVPKTGVGLFDPVPAWTTAY